MLTEFQGKSVEMFSENIKIIGFKNRWDCKDFLKGQYTDSIFYVFE